jgi:trehalose 6-phosphate synthase
VPADYFTTLPDDVSYAVIDGMLGADVIGFHTDRWAQLFGETVRAVTGRGTDAARVFPLGVDPEEIGRLAGRRDVAAAGRVLAQTVGDRKVIGRVDRTEPAKNVWRGLLAYRELLRRYPEWRGRVVHTVYNNPSRDDLPAYREYTAAIERLASDIDDEFATDDWTPATVDIVDDYPSGLAVMQRSDVVFINSIRDGMNLVVLESLLINERDPAVVISRDTGAAEVLGDAAITVNPFDVSAAADALHEALLMPADERRQRVERMRRAAVALPPGEWFQAQLDALPEKRQT